MDTNDFLGSFAQENVAFQTEIIRSTKVGDNFYKAMIFVEDSRYVDTSGDQWILAPGTNIKCLTVTAADYAEYTTGLLQSWLFDLFCNGFTGDCILVACGDITATYQYTPVTLENGADIEGLGYYHRAAGSSDEWELATETTADTSTYEYASRSATGADSDAFIEKMTEAYKLLKAYAYHKTVCAGIEVDTGAALDTNCAVALATLCAEDKGLLSSAPYYPYATTSPANPSSDPIYSAVKNAGKDAFFSAYQDATRNAALYSLGLAMSSLNGSGTCVGNSLDMSKSNNIASSGPSGAGLSKEVRTTLAGLNIQTFKAVGNNSGSVAAVGAETIQGDTVQATWILAYITYMSKVAIAEMITVPNFLKNAANYSRIVTVLSTYLALFGPNGSGRLSNLSVTAPAFEALPEAKEDQIIIPNAWSATYVDQVREVQITGSLYIGA